MDAVRHYGLDITRSFFLAGKLPYPYMASVNACIYLSTNPDEVKTAVAGGFPAGYVLPCAIRDDVADHQLRVAFDFDGVVVDDEAVYKETQDLELFHHYERERRNLPLKGGPLLELLRRISHFQKLDKKKSESVPGYERRLRIAIVTARNAPAHERLITSIANLEIDTDELFLLGGIEKKRVLDVLKPHIILTINWGISLPLRMTSLRYIFHLALPIHPNSDSGAKRDREALHSR